MPNITGSFAENYHDQSANMTADGCFKLNSQTAEAIRATASNRTLTGWVFDAFLSSSTYQNGASVHPNSVSTLLIIKH